MPKGVTHQLGKPRYLSTENHSARQRLVKETDETKLFGVFHL